MPRPSSTARRRIPPSGTPSNPLDLSQPPGTNPLSGASFFVPGPAYGAAAQAIVALTGLRPARATETWAHYSARLHEGAVARRLSANPGLAHQVAELAKIAGEPETQRFSSYVGHGKPSALFAQVRRIFCVNLASDPGSIPVITTYFMHADLGQCPTPAKVRADRPIFERRINAVTAATGRRPAVFLLEVDALGTSKCVTASGAMREWETDLRYEIAKIAALPHTIVYVEGGYSDSNSPAYTARILNAIGIHTIRGFFTNDTHLNWTINEVNWATKVSQLTGGAHFIVNTADNGQGPLLNPHPRTQGIENLCNPPGRGLGPSETTDTGLRARRRVAVGPSAGQQQRLRRRAAERHFWPAKAIGLAERANQRLGPALPSRPYCEPRPRPAPRFTRISYVVRASEDAGLGVSPLSLSALATCICRTCLDRWSLSCACSRFCWRCLPCPHRPARPASSMTPGWPSSAPDSAGGRSPARRFIALGHAADDAQQCAEPSDAVRDPGQSARPARGAGGRSRSPAPGSSSRARRAAPPPGRSRGCSASTPRRCRSASHGRRSATSSPSDPWRPSSPAIPGSPARSPAVDRRRPARVPADLAATPGAAVPAPSSSRRRRSCAGTCRPIPARSRSSTPTSCTPTWVAARPPTRSVPTSRRSSAASTRWPRPSTAGPPSSCSRSTGSAPRTASGDRDRCALWEADLRYEMRRDAVAPPHRRLRRGRVLGLQLGRLHRPRPAGHRGATDPRASSPTTPTSTGRSTRSRWATAIARRTGGAHFIVNTADNGRGPLLNRAIRPRRHRGPLQSARPRPRPARHHRHRLSAGRRVAVDPPARQQLRLRRRASRRGLLAGARRGRRPPTPTGRLGPGFPSLPY